MKKMQKLLLVLVVAASSAQAQHQQHLNAFSPSRQYAVEERETIRRTLEFSPGNGAKTLEVDSVQGAIRVVGYDGRNVEMVVEKTIRADSQDLARVAKDKVKLDIADKADIVNIYVDQPGHHRYSTSSNRFDWSLPGYEVVFDFELRVPRQTAVHLWSVLSSNINVDNIEGDFDISNLNGDIDMTAISGSGRLRTLNGSVSVKFANNPKMDTSFSSLNGEIDVTFPRNLSADLRFKSFNGDVYTDFPVTALPTAVTQTRNSRVYKNDFHSVRIGSGGPMLEFDGFNGDVLIRQAK